jgi:hypothetical protein
MRPIKSTAITTGISIKPDLLAKAKKRSAASDISLSKFISRILAAHLSKNKKDSK